VDELLMLRLGFAHFGLPNSKVEVPCSTEDQSRFGMVEIIGDVRGGDAAPGRSFAKEPIPARKTMDRGPPWRL